MANGTDPFAGQEQDPFQETPTATEPIHVGNTFGQWGPKIVKDPNVEGWKGYGIEVPDINFDFLKIEPGEDEDPEKLSAVESLRNTWNNSLDQLSLADDRFYHLSEQLFGDEDSKTFKDAEARIAASETGDDKETLALQDIPDAFEEEGLVGGIAHAGAAAANALSAFATSALQAYVTGGSSLAVDMVQGSLRDYTKARAEEDGVSYKEASQGLGTDVIIPIGLGALAYKFEKAGIKGVGKAIKGLQPGAAKAIIATLNAAGKEGGTELAQGVVEAFNQGLGAKNSLDEAAESVGTFWKEDALETLLQGAVGGGLSAGGGRALRKAASTLRSGAAERSLTETGNKILEIDKMLNNPDVSDAEKKILKRTRTSLKKTFDKAVNEPNKIVQRLTDDKIDKIVKKSNDNRRLRDELRESRIELDDDAYSIVEEDIHGRLRDNADSIDSILEDQATQLLRDADGELNAPSTEKADALNAKLKEGDKSTETFHEAVDTYKPLIRSVAKSLFKQQKEHGEQAYEFEDFVHELTYNDSSHSFKGLFDSYKPEIGSFGGYAKKYLKSRGTRVLDKAVKGSDQTTGLESASNVEAEGPAKAKQFHTRRIVDRLGFDSSTAQGFEDAVRKVLKSKKLKTGTKQGFNKAVTAAGREALADQVRVQLGAKDDLFRNLQKNVKQYKNIIPKSAYNNSRGETRAWAENPPTDREFINYFRGVDVDRKVRAKRKEALARWIADGIFTEAAADLLQDPDVAKQFELVQDFQKGDAVNSINAARIQMINKVPISESRINGVAGAVLKREDVTPSDQMNAVLQQAWRANDFNANSTTNQNFAEHFLVRNGVFNTREEAANYINGVNGFAIKKPDGEVFIYSNKDGKPETLIHEYGHIWSDFVLHTNPQLWEQIIGEIILERDTYFARETNRLFDSGYYDKFGKDARAVIEGLYNASTDTQRASILRRVMSNPSKHSGAILALDEIMAGAIERHGKKKFDDSLGTKLSQLLDKFWDHIAKLLGNVKGKEIQDLNIQELMDLVVNDVVTGKPGSSFAEMNIPVGNEMFEKEVGAMREGMTAEQRKDQNLFDALSILKEDVTFDKIDKAYEKVADQMSKKEFLDMINKAIDQNAIDLAGLQEGFFIDDAFDPDVKSGNTDGIWKRLAGTKVPRLGVFTRHTKKKIDGKRQKISAEEHEAKLDKKLEVNGEFISKNKELYAQFLPKGFWKMAQKFLASGEYSKTGAFLSEELGLEMIENSKDDGLVWDNKDRNQAIKKLNTPAKIQKFKEKYDHESDQSMDALMAFGDALQNLANAGVPKSDLATLARTFLNPEKADSSIIRRAPKVVGYSGNMTGQTIAEHNPPAGSIAMTIFEYASKGAFDDSVKNAIREKFGYWVLDHAQDPSGDLIAAPTKNFDIVKDDPIVRYVVAGVNLADTYYVDGQSVAEKYGVEKHYAAKAKTDPKFETAVNNAVRKEVIEPKAVVVPANPDGTGATIDDKGVITFPNGKRIPTTGNSLGAKTFNAALEAVRSNPKITGPQFFEQFIKDNDTKKSSTDYYLGFAKKWNNQNKIDLKESRKATPDKELANILEQKTGVKADKQFDAVDIKNANSKFKLGKFWLPPSAEDLKGLIYSLIPGGAEGNKALEFFDQNLFRPYSEAQAQYNKEKLAGFDSVKNLAKAFNLSEDAGEGLTGEQAVRIYLFQESGQDVTGLDQAKIDAANAYVTKTNPKVKGLVQKVLNATNGKFDTFEADTWLAGSLQGDMFGYFNDARRKEIFQPWKDSKNAIFTQENLDKLKVTHGEDFVKSLQNTFTRMESGRNRTISPDSSTNRVLDWLNNAVGTTMFLNMRSAALQTLSTVNYLFEPGTIKGMLSSQFPGAVVELWNSDYLRARRGDSGFDLQASEVSDAVNDKNGFKKLVSKMIQFGFKPTKAVDSAAIAFLGAAYYVGQMKNGATKEEAMRKWMEVSEENQQSARPDKISKIQSGPLGRIIFAFGNTPFQYARLTKRGLQDIFSGRSFERGTAGKDFAKIAWYGAVQSLIFTQLQNAVSFFDDEEEDTKDEWAINSFVTSYLKAFGGPGAIASAAYSILRDLKKTIDGEYVPGGLMNSAVSISPPISAKLRKLNKINKEARSNPEDLIDPTTEAFWKTLGYGLNVGVNVPLDRGIEKFENLKAATEEDYSAIAKLALIFGWKPWQLEGQKGQKSTEADPFSGDTSGVDPFGNDNSGEDPFKRGEVGQAHRDGTIEVDPNLTPIERQKTIDHETKHVQQMKEDGLDYDDDTIYFKNKTYRRKDGKIRYAGRWVPEGDPRLPWEAEAYEAETPLKRTTGTGTTGTGDLVGEKGGHGVEGGVDEDRFDKDGNLITDPKLIDKSLRKADAKADQFTTDWYNDPETRKRLKHQTGLTDEQIDERIKHATGVETREALISYADAESHDPGTFMGQMIPEGEEGYFPGRIDVGVNPDLAGNEGLLEHEQAHQLRFDNQLGYKASKILGKAKEEYLNNPGEIYGNMQEFRSILGLKPSQRDLTPAKIKKIIKDKGLENQSDVQQLLYNFDIGKLSKALNTIAEAKPKKKTLRDYYA